MNKNITDIRCVNDDCLLCKNSKGNYCITDFDYNDLFDSNVSVLNDDICSVSKGGNYFAVARNKNITVIDTKINQKVEIHLDNDIFTVCFVNDSSLFYSEMSNIDDINSNYDGYSDMSGFHDSLYVLFNNHLFTEQSNTWLTDGKLDETTIFPINYWIEYIRLYQNDEYGDLYLA